MEVFQYVGVVWSFSLTIGIYILNGSATHTSWSSNRTGSVNVLWHVFELLQECDFCRSLFGSRSQPFASVLCIAIGLSFRMDPNPSQKSDSSRGMASTPNGGVDRKGEAPAQPKTRVKKPRIDIDNEIKEANRLSEVLRKVAQAAKTTAKNGTRAKQRLVRKAGKLSSEDLERIAVLKRCGLFTGVMKQTDPHTSLETSETGMEDNVMADKQNVRNKIAQTMSHITGADELFGDFQMVKNPRLQSPDVIPQPMSMQKVKNPGAVLAGSDHAIVAQPLPAAATKPAVGASTPKK
jgi:hypothetical protein